MTISDADGLVARLEDLEATSVRLARRYGVLVEQQGADSAEVAALRTERAGVDVALSDARAEIARRYAEGSDRAAAGLTGDGPGLAGDGPQAIAIPDVDPTLRPKAIAIGLAAAAVALVDLAVVLTR